MAASDSYIARSDDTAAVLRKIATEQYTINAGADTVEAQVVMVADPTTPTQKQAVDASGNAKVIAASNSGVDIGDVTINNSTGAAAVNVQDGGNSLTVDGTLTVTQATATNLKVDASGVAVPVTDNAGSLTVDNAQLSVVGTGTEATAMRVTIATDSTGVLSVDDNGASLTVDNAQLSVVGSGTEAAAMRVTIATDSTGVLSVDDNGASLTVDNATISVVGSGTEATAQRVTIATDSTGVLSVDDNGGSLTVDGSVTAIPGTATSGGLTTYHLASAGSTNATVVKNAAGQLYGWYILNTNAAARYLAFHNASSAPTAGASIFFKLGIPASSAANVFAPQGIAFSTGISITTVTGAADNDNTGVAANDLIINLWYA